MNNTSVEKIIEDLLDDVGEFTWMFGMLFFVETAKGNFLWSDPDYNGDNSFRSFDGSYADYVKLCGHHGRDKGFHVISAYCGDKIWLGKPTSTQDYCKF